MMARQGYEFVPLPDEVHREQRGYAAFDATSRSTMGVLLDVRFVAMEPVHVGSGFWTLRNDRALRALARSSGRPVIPGSSMKGLLRARYEAMTRSCVGHRPPKNATLDDQLPSRSYPHHDVSFSDSVRNHGIFRRCRKPEICAACALFGLMSQRGRVSVHDLLVPEGSTIVDAELPRRFSPRPHHLGLYAAPRQSERRLVVHTLHGRKFHVGNAPPPTTTPDHAETIKVGTILSGRIICTNVTEAELGGLLSALGIHPASTLKIGSAKAHRFGRLGVAGVGRVDVVKRPKGFDEEGFFERVRKTFTTSRDYWAAGEAALLEMHGRG